MFYHQCRRDKHSNVLKLQDTNVLKITNVLKSNVLKQLRERTKICFRRFCTNQNDREGEGHWRWRSSAWLQARSAELPYVRYDRWPRHRYHAQRSITQVERGTTENIGLRQGSPEVSNRLTSWHLRCATGVTPRGAHQILSPGPVVTALTSQHLSSQR